MLRARKNKDGTHSLVGDTTKAITIQGVIESGSNANGSYTKFPDGTMIQTGYKADTGTSMTITYPVPFVEEVYTVQCQMVSNAANYQNITIATNYATSLSGVNIIWDSSTNGITWMAIGRWK